MILRIDECEGVAGGFELLADIVKYKDISKWCTAILDHQDGYNPLWMSIKWDGKAHMLLDSGEEAPDARVILKRLTKLPKYRRAIPTDKLLITADVFERELEIDLDGDVN